MRFFLLMSVFRTRSNILAFGILSHLMTTTATAAAPISIHRRFRFNNRYFRSIQDSCDTSKPPTRDNSRRELRWIEVDLPELLGYKEEVLAGKQPRCKLERVRLDLAEICSKVILLLSGQPLAGEGDDVMVMKRRHNLRPRLWRQRLR